VRSRGSVCGVGHLNRSRAPRVGNLDVTGFVFVAVLKAKKKTVEKTLHSGDSLDSRVKQLEGRQLLIELNLTFNLYFGIVWWVSFETSFPGRVSRQQLRKKFDFEFLRRGCSGPAEPTAKLELIADGSGLWDRCELGSIAILYL